MRFPLIASHAHPTAHCSLLTTNYSLLTTQYPPLCSLLTVHYQLLTARCSCSRPLGTAYCFCSLLTAHCSLLTAHCSLTAHYTKYCSLSTTHELVWLSLLFCQKNYTYTALAATQIAGQPAPCRYANLYADHKKWIDQIPVPKSAPGDRSRSARTVTAERAGF